MRGASPLVGERCLALPLLAAALIYLPGQWGAGTGRGVCVCVCDRLLRRLAPPRRRTGHRRLLARMSGTILLLRAAALFTASPTGTAFAIATGRARPSSASGTSTPSSASRQIRHPSECWCGTATRPSGSSVSTASATASRPGGRRDHASSPTWCVIKGRRRERYAVPKAHFRPATRLSSSDPPPRRIDFGSLRAEI